MLSILYSDFEQFGCPNCGCDAARGSCVSGGGLSSATCRHCGLHFEVRIAFPILYGLAILYVKWKKGI